jgi:DNA invertase Pin-like site-specific DNA recombinase
VFGLDCERAKLQRTGTSPVVGYVRVSTAEQADSGLRLEAQRRAIHQECDRRGWELLGIEEDAGGRARWSAAPGSSGP